MEIFFTHYNKNLLYDKDITPNAILIAPPPKTLKERRFQKIETLFEKQTRFAHNLSKLLCLRIKQIDRYGHVLDFKSNIYHRY